MGTLLKKWAEWIQAQGFAPGSVRDHRQKLQPFLKFLAGDDPREADRERLAAYQTHLFEFVSRKTGKHLSCNSQINRLTALKNFYRFLHQTGRIAINPAEVIVLPRHPKLLPPVLLKTRELRALLDAPDLGNPLGFRDRVIMEVLVTQDWFVWPTEPTRNTKRIETEVLLENGETAVIGGIYQQETAENVSKVPLLGDIPGLGILFRTRSRNDNRTELLIFLTPRIINPALSLGAAEQDIPPAT